MNSLTRYSYVVLGLGLLVFLSTCKDPYTTPENLICYEPEPCIVDNDCKTILAPRSAYAGKTFEIEGETYTVVCNLLIREMIKNEEDISRVITTLVTDMSGLFEQDSLFNVDISNWDVSNVTNMESMFRGASSFNQDISCWDVNNVVNMNSMFNGASSFNQDLSNWNVKEVTACNDFAINTVAWELQKPGFVSCDF